MTIERFTNYHDCGTPINREHNQSLRYLSKEEIDLLLYAASDHLRPVLVTAICTGMRAGEILNLEWSRVDFGTGLITVEETKSWRGPANPHER